MSRNFSMTPSTVLKRRSPSVAVARERAAVGAQPSSHLVRDRVVHGPAMQSVRLVSRGYTNAKKTLAATVKGPPAMLDSSDGICRKGSV